MKIWLMSCLQQTCLYKKMCRYFV